MSLNITTKQSHYNASTIIILLFCMWSGQLPGPRPAGSGRARASNGAIVLRAGRAWTYFLRAGPGRDRPHNSICGPGPSRVCTTAAGPGRAWASYNICGPGLDLNFRLMQSPNIRICRGRWRVGPYKRATTVRCCNGCNALLGWEDGTCEGCSKLWPAYCGPLTDWTNGIWQDD